MQPALRHRPTPIGWIAGVVAVVGLVAGLAAWAGRSTAPAAPSPAPRAASPDVAGAQEARTIRVAARKYAFSPARIEVQQDDLVKVTLEAADIPHSFTIDEPYRIAKRATPGHPAEFEFRADKAGTFEFYCNLKIDDGCRKMKGELVVKPKQ